MFNWFKKKEKVNKKPVIICIHGFGKRRTDEFIPLYENLKNDYEVIMPELYNQQFVDDRIWHNWVSRAEEKIIEAKNNHREIILIGFSMGGVIASYLASKFEIKKLILLAPAFEYISVQTASSAINHVVKKKPETISKYIPLPKEFTDTFINVVDNCKKGIEKISCPVLFIADMDDEVIPYSVSLKYYKKVPHERKRCVILAEGQHRLLDDEKAGNVAIQIIRDFIEDRIII